MRNEELKEKVDAFIEGIEIDVCELESYKYTPAFNDYIHNPEPPEEDWDEDEEYERKLDKAEELIEADGLCECLELELDEEEENKMQGQALAYINDKRS